MNFFKQKNDININNQLDKIYSSNTTCINLDKKIIEKYEIFGIINLDKFKNLKI